MGLNCGLEHLNHVLEHGKMEKKSVKSLLGPIFLSKKAYVMFLRVLEVFLGCFSRSAYRERRRREHGSKPRSRAWKHGKPAKSKNFLGRNSFV